jgi:predicted aspartyl protease
VLEEGLTPLKIEPKTGLLMATIQVGTTAGQWIVDTGASHSVISTGFSSKANLDASGIRVVVPNSAAWPEGLADCVRAESMAMGGLRWEQSDLLRADLSNLSHILGQPVEGILGMNHLTVRPFEINPSLPTLRHMRKLEKPDTGQIAVRAEGNRYWLKAVLLGRTKELLIDTGASRSSLPDGAVVEVESVPSDDVVAVTPFAEDVREKTRSRQVEVAEIQSGENSWSNWTFAVQQGQAKLGMSTLTDYRCVFDPGMKRAWMIRLPPR